MTRYARLDLRLVCMKCFRLPRTQGYDWCSRCLRKLAIVGEYDQQEAEREER